MQPEEVGVARIKVKGILFLDLFDNDGNLKDHREILNIFTGDGTEYLTGLILKNSSGTMSYIGIGVGAIAAATGDNALGTERGSRRTAATAASASGTGSPTYQIEYTFGVDNPETAYDITEAGLFNANSGGSMGSRQVFSAIAKATADTLKITWRWNIS